MRMEAVANEAGRAATSCGGAAESEEPTGRLDEQQSRGTMGGARKRGLDDQDKGQEEVMGDEPQATLEAATSTGRDVWRTLRDAGHSDRAAAVAYPYPYPHRTLGPSTLGGTNDSDRTLLYSTHYTMPMPHTLYRRWHA